MRVRVTQAMAGRSFCYRAGQVVEMEEEMAERWIAGKLATRVDPPAPPRPAFEPHHNKHRKR